MGAWIGHWLGVSLADATLLYSFQAVLLGFLIFAEMKDQGRFNKRTGAYATVTRGATSWNHLNLAFGIVAINILQIINSADDETKFKVAMSVFDLLATIRLFFFNGWFRNQALGLVGLAQSLEEGKKAMPKPPGSDADEGGSNAQ